MISEQGTILTQVKIDVGTHGVKFTIEGLEADIAALITNAVGYTALDPEYHSYDSSTVVIKSNKVLKFVDPEPTE